MTRTPRIGGEACDVEAILESMRANANNGRRQEDACSRLSAYTGTCSIAQRENLRKLDTISLLVRAMNGHRRRARLQEHAIYALCNLAYSHAPTRDKIIQTATPNNNGLIAVIRAMRQHPNAEGVQSGGCFALRHFAFDHIDNQRSCIANGAIPTLLTAMKHHPQSERVQFAASIALLVLSDRYENRAAFQSWRNRRLTKRALRAAIENHPHKCGARAQTILNRCFPQKELEKKTES